MLIQIEGNEGSGKTTLINNLTNLIAEDKTLSKFHYRWIHLPSKQSPFGRICRQILKGDTSYLRQSFRTEQTINKEIVITLCAFLDQYIMNNNSAELFEDTITIESRGILSNLVYADLSSTNFNENFTQYVLPLITLLPKPDLIIYLKQDTEVLKNRINKRSEVDKKIYDDVQLLDLINTRFDKVIKLFPSWNIVTIENSLNPDKCADIALDLIKNLVSKNNVYS